MDLVTKEKIGTMRFMASNDPAQVEIIQSGLTVRKATNQEDGVIAMSQVKLPPVCSVRLLVEKGGTSGSGYIGIGIAEPELLNVHPCYCNRENGVFVTYLNYKGGGLLCCGDLKVFSDFGEPFKTKDIVGFDLDLYEKEIIFYKNEKRFPTIDLSKLKETGVHLAVWLMYPGDQVSIVDYKVS